MPSTAAGKPDAKGYRLMIPNASRHTDKTLPCSSAHTGTFIVPPASAASPSEGTPTLLVRGPPQLVLKCNPPPWRKAVPPRNLLLTNANLPWHLQSGSSQAGVVAALLS